MVEGVTSRLDTLIDDGSRLLTPSGGMWQILGVGAIAWTNGFRLPAGSRWQWALVDAGAAASMRLRWGSNPTAALEVLAAPGMSAVHVHPGREVYVEFQANPGDRIWVFVSPSKYGQRKGS